MCKFNLTIAFIEESFNKFNKEYFDGVLTTPHFAIDSSRRHLGLFRWRNRDFTIIISNFYDRSQREYENTIIHEMIHHYIRQNNIKDTRKHHGRVFYFWCDKINALGGWNLARTDSVAGCNATENMDNLIEYNVCVFQDPHGKYFRFVMNKNYIKEFVKHFRRNSSWFGGWKIFKSNDGETYASYPACRTGVRGHYITKSEYEKENNEYGNTIKIAV